MTIEDQGKALEEAKKRALIDSNRRKIAYADVETQIIQKEKQIEAIQLFCMLVQKYNISSEDVYTLLDSVPFI